MRLYAAGATSTNGGTAARAVGYLMAIASREGFVREIGVFNTTVTACAFRTFGARGLHIPAGTATGIGIVPIGTGQVVEFYIDWME